MKRLFATIALSLSLAMTAPAVLPQTAVIAVAAEKAEVSCGQTEICVTETTQVYVSNMKEKATYTYSSNKKSVATVSKDGVVTGKAAGKAKITVKETYNGKKTTVGTVTITVKKAGIYTDYEEEYGEMWVSAQPGLVTKSNSWDVNMYDHIVNRNPKATYKIYSNTKNLTITTKGKVTAVKKAGTAKLTIKETYKGKTTKVGTFKVQMIAPTYTGDSVITAYVGDRMNMYSYMQACGGFYFCYSNDELPNDKTLLASINDGSYVDAADTIISEIKDEDYWEGDISIDRAGTCYCVLAQYNYKTETFDKVFGRFQIVAVDEEN